MKQFITTFLLIAISLATFAQKRVKVASVGNSITFGTGIEQPEKNSYPAQLQQLLGDKYEVANFGKPGATLLKKGHRPYTQQQEYKDALAFDADIVVIHLGINDTDPRNWPNFKDEFTRDYLNLIESFRADKNKRILIARLTPIAHEHPRFNSGTRDWRIEIQQEIERIAQIANVELIDFEKPLYAFPAMLPDAIHPNRDGASKLAATVYSAITGDYNGLAMSSIYSDGMVLQRNKYLNIDGVANAGEVVTLEIAGQKHKTVANNQGYWSVNVLPIPAGGPYVMSISTPNQKLQFNDVLIGEVWLCSGQSNMEFMLKQTTTAKEDIPESSNNAIRLYNMKARWRTDAVAWSQDVLDSINNLYHYNEASWQSSSPKSASDFSAVAYYFGKMLRDSLNVPIGLICNAVGGSPTEAWIDRATLEMKFPNILKDWRHNDFIQDWVRKRAGENLKNSNNKKQRHPYEPCYLFESGIQPLNKFPIAGVIWYQGESNAHNVTAHEKLFTLLTQSWRNNWNDAALPFYYVQLSSINRPTWPEFRDSQRKLSAEIPYVGMAVSSDLGDSLDVHPRNKKPIGERLARLALNETYGITNLASSGPMFKGATLQDGAILITFDNTSGLSTSDNQPIRTFEIAEIEGLYYPADAEIVQNGVRLSRPDMKHPRFVRYGWQPFTRANLVNSDQLPASTFKSEVSLPSDLIEVQKMSSNIKDDKNFNKGVSACYAGVYNGQLLMAGGCNFPAKPAAQGGSKKYYSNIYAATLNEDSLLTWKRVGNLPKPMAYGVSVVTPEGLICIGGMNNEKSLSDVYRISFNKRGVDIKPLPSLPVAIDNMSGALLGNVIYVVGGNVDGKASNQLYLLDLDRVENGWQTALAFPGTPRVQPIVAVQNDENMQPSLYVWGGFSLPTQQNEAVISVDGYKFTPGTGVWSHLPAPLSINDTPLTLSGGSALSWVGNRIIAIGGVNKEKFTIGLNKSDSNYLNHPVEWYNFNSRLMSFDTRKSAWMCVDAHPYLARAGAAFVTDGKYLYVIHGELKPGIRTNQVSRIKL